MEYTDTQRLDWIMPILELDDGVSSDVKNERAIKLTNLLLFSKTGREAIDLAMMNEEKI